MEWHGQGLIAPLDADQPDDRRWTSDGGDQLVLLQAGAPSAIRSGRTVISSHAIPIATPIDRLISSAGIREPVRSPAAGRRDMCRRPRSHPGRS